MSYWDIKNKVNRLVKDHNKTRTKNRVIPWWTRDDFVSRGEPRERIDMKKIKRLWQKKVAVPFLETQAENLLKKVHDKIKKGRNKDK